MRLDNFLFLTILGVTFAVLAVCNYYREVTVDYCYDSNRLVYINYAYFPLHSSYKEKYNCKTKNLQHYKLYNLKNKLSK